MSSTSQCRDCNQTIYWHESKSGKKYPCNSENRRDFHQCQGAPPAQSTPAQRLAPLQSAPSGDIERRLQWLERQVHRLLQADGVDIPF